MSEKFCSVQWGTPPREEAILVIPASKSELNRFLVLAALRPGLTRIEGKSACDDVLYMMNALRSFGAKIVETRTGYEISGGGREKILGNPEPASVDCGSGGTTLRFLLALAAARSGPTELKASPQLLARPQEPWVDCLLSLGATVEVGESSLLVRGSTDWPARIEVDVRVSSQFASALGLLATAQAHPTEIVFTGEPVSEPYWRLTLHCVREVGGEAAEKSSGARISPPDAEAGMEELELRTEADASSAAVWLAAGALGFPVVVANYPKSRRQADSRLLSFLPEFGSEVRRTKDGVRALPAKGAAKDREFDLRDAPDLAPVLAALSALCPGKTRIKDAEHLRFKESNRIEDLVAALAAVGIGIRARKDGFETVGGQMPTPGTIDPRGDHRLAMAAALFAARGAKITVADAGVVSKSYPEFWAHAAAVGWKVDR